MLRDLNGITRICSIQENNEHGEQPRQTHHSIQSNHSYSYKKGRQPRTACTKDRLLNWVNHPVSGKSRILPAHIGPVSWTLRSANQVKSTEVNQLMSLWTNCKMTAWTQPMRGWHSQMSRQNKPIAEDLSKELNDHLCYSSGC